MDGDRTLLRVELESDSEPIAGRIREPGGRTDEVAGYTSLIEAWSGSGGRQGPVRGLPHRRRDSHIRR